MRAFRNVNKYIHQSNLVEGYDDPAADVALKRAWEYLRDTRTGHMRKALDHDIIKHTHELAMSWRPDSLDIWPGAYRDRSRVTVTRFNDQPAVAPEKVQKAMDDWLAGFADRPARENHVLFETIKPFVDGNNVVNRLLLWYQELCLEDNTPTFINEDNINDYYKWFEGDSNEA